MSDSSEAHESGSELSEKLNEGAVSLRGLVCVC